MRALGRVAGYAEWLRQPPGVLPALSGVDRRRGATGGDGPPSALLAAYGIERRAVAPAGSGADAALAAAASARLSGGGEGGRRRAAAPHGPRRGAARAGRRGRRPGRVRASWPAAFGPDVLVQTMVAARRGLRGRGGRGSGVRPGGGFGLGGVASELLGDLAWRAAPLTDRAAAALVDEPRAAPLLHGYRGCGAGRPRRADRPAAAGRPAGRRASAGAALSLNPVLARRSRPARCCTPCPGRRAGPPRHRPPPPVRPPRPGFRASPAGGPELGQLA